VFAVGHRDESRPVILVVDDEENQRLYYRDELEDAGYAVITAASGPEALEIVQQRKVHLVLLDIAMPGMDGVETLARLLDIDRQLPIVINTAYSDYRDDFTTWAADAYVTKSSDPATLHQRIREILAERGIDQPKPSQGAADCE
jgi:two-component system response regulator (stage 0 sporulation protein F)